AVGVEHADPGQARQEYARRGAHPSRLVGRVSSVLELRGSVAAVSLRRGVCESPDTGSGLVGVAPEEWGMLAGMTTTVTLRPRRSCLAVPGSNPRFLEKAKGLPADQVFLDLEDACAPLVKPEARKNIVAALNEGGWGEKIRVVRVNDWTTHWTYRDVVEVVEGAGPNLDCLMLPKVQNAEQVVALDILLTQIEKTMGFEVGRIGIEAQIENAAGLIAVDAIAK